MTSPPVRRGVVGVLVKDGRLLVIRRSQHVRSPGMYCFPGGGIEAGETETAAVVRELQEELALAVRPIRQLWRKLTPWKIDLSWWLIECDDLTGLVPNLAEVESVHWHTPWEISQLTGLLASNHEFLAAFTAQEFAIDGLPDGLGK